MAKETLTELKIRVFKREMKKAGFMVQNYSEKEITTMALDAFKGKDGKNVKSFGATFSREGNDIVIQKIQGTINARKREQIESFVLDGTAFSSQIAAANFNEAYGVDLFKFLEDNNIGIYNISEGWYIDPEANTKRYFADMVDLT